MAKIHNFRNMIKVNKKNKLRKTTNNMNKLTTNRRKSDKIINLLHSLLSKLTFNNN